MKTSHIGSNLKYYRESKNLTQEQLADKVGVTCEMISRYERGINEPYKKIDLIADALNISKNELLQDKNSEIFKESYEIPLFTKIPENYDFSPSNTTYFYTCAKWMYVQDRELFAIDMRLIKKNDGVYYITKKIFPRKKNLVLCIKENKLIVDDFKNQKEIIGTVIAFEKKCI